MFDHFAIEVIPLQITDTKHFGKDAAILTNIKKAIVAFPWGKLVTWLNCSTCKTNLSHPHYEVVPSHIWYLNTYFSLGDGAQLQKDFKCMVPTDTLQRAIGDVNEGRMGI